MSSAHTPGPWSAPRGSVGIFAADGRLIATMDAPNNIPENFAANAHLIAAAPELLEALQQIAVLDAGVGNFKVSARVRKAANIARVAIAKAEGK